MKATWMLNLYPADWRRRYEPEFRALLELQDVSVLDSFDIAVGAVDAHLRPQRAGRTLGGDTPMPSLPSDGEAVRIARQRVDELKLFYGHLALFLVINLALLAINVLTTPDVLWVLFPVWGWGIVLAAHTGLTFRWHDLFGAHLAAFLVASAGFMSMNWAFGGYPWSAWVVGSLGILLLCHALLAFNLTDLFGAHLVATILVSGELLLVARLTDESLLNLVWVILSLVVVLVGHAVLRSRQASLYQVHLVSFVVVNLMLFLENVTTDDGILWFQYPLIAWSVLLAVHTLVRFRFLGFPDDSWESTRLAGLSARANDSADLTVRSSPGFGALQERVRVQRALLLHLFFFAVGVIDLAVLNIVSSPSTLWMVWPVAAWTVLLATHLGYTLVPARLFGAHLFAAIALSIGLVAIDLWTGSGTWAYWPILGLALTVLIHAGFAFNARRLVDHWEERQIETLLK